MGSNPTTPAKTIKGYALVNCLTDIVYASTLQCPLKTKMRKFINYCKESYTELTKKVTWPTWKSLQSSAILVAIATLIFAGVIWFMDFAFEYLMVIIYNLKK